MPRVERNSKKTHCPRGHAYDAAYTHPQSGKRKRICLSCRKIHNSKPRIGTIKKPKTHCINGHEYDGTRMVRGTLRPLCKTCKRDQDKRSNLKSYIKNKRIIKLKRYFLRKDRKLQKEENELKNLEYSVRVSDSGGSDFVVPWSGTVNETFSIEPEY